MTFLTLLLLGHLLPAALTSPIAAPSPAAAVAARAGPDGGFYSDCSSAWSLGYRGSMHFVVASRCVGGEGALHTSALSLNDCLGNSGGLLKAGAIGKAFQSCQDCSASPDSAVLSCRCKDAGSALRATSIDLDTVLWNNDGIISCFDFPGFEISPAETL